MTLRLTVDERRWRDHVASIASRVPGLVAVVKGNGYGFGRAQLASTADELIPHDTPIGVGTVHEVAGMPTSRPLLVLSPHVGALPSTVRTMPPGAVILCVGAEHHLDALVASEWRGDVHLKLRSSMQRYGCAPALVGSLLAAVHDAGFPVVGFTLHLPLAGSDADRATEIEGWLDVLDHLDSTRAGVSPSTPFAVSHLSVDAFSDLVKRRPSRPLQLRLGTALWHGDKSMLRLSADVTDVSPVHAGERAGYRATAAPTDGSIVMVAAGTAHGVTPLPDGRSPLHFARRRLELLEPPHMHSTMAIAPAGSPCPQPGDWVDVQRPLTMVSVDEVVWA